MRKTILARQLIRKDITTRSTIQIHNLQTMWFVIDDDTGTMNYMVDAELTAEIEQTAACEMTS